MQYQVNIVGQVWAGYESGYSYPCETIPADLAAVKRLAGDFQSVHDFEVTSLTAETEDLENGWREVRTFQVVRPWATEDAELAFAESEAAQ